MGTIAVLTHFESVFVWMAEVETAVKVCVTRRNGSRRTHARTQTIVSAEYKTMFLWPTVYITCRIRPKCFPLAHHGRNDLY